MQDLPDRSQLEAMIMKTLLSSTAVSLALGLSVFSSAQAASFNFNAGVNTPSTTLLSTLSSQQTAGKTISTVTIAPKATVTNLNSTSIGKTIATVNLAPVATVTNLNSTTIGKIVSGVTLAPVGVVSNLNGTSIGKAVSGVTIAATATVNNLTSTTKTPVTSAGGLLANTAGTFAVPNVKITIATGPITVLRSSGFSGDSGSDTASMSDSSGDLSNNPTGTATLGSSTTSPAVYTQVGGGQSGPLSNNPTGSATLGSFTTSPAVYTQVGGGQSGPLSNNPTRRSIP